MGVPRGAPGGAPKNPPSGGPPKPGPLGPLLGDPRGTPILGPPGPKYGSPVNIVLMDPGPWLSPELYIMGECNELIRYNYQIKHILTYR